MVTIRSKEDTSNSQFIAVANFTTVLNLHEKLKPSSEGPFATISSASEPWEVIRRIDIVFYKGTIVIRPAGSMVTILSVVLIRYLRITPRWLFAGIQTASRQNNKEAKLS